MNNNNSSIPSSSCVDIISLFMVDYVTLNYINTKGKEDIDGYIKFSMIFQIVILSFKLIILLSTPIVMCKLYYKI